MANTLLDAESEAPADADSQTSEPEENTTLLTPEKEDAPNGDPPADGESEGAPEKDSEEGQSKSEKAEPKEDEGSFDDLALGENSPLSEEHVEGIVELAVANDLSPKQAQALLDRDEARAVVADENWSATVEGWESDFRADKDFGGEHLDTSVANARTAMSKFGPPGFIEALNQSGFGNNPDLLRFAANVGARMAETDKIINGSTASGDSNPTWNTLFPESGAPPSERTI
jgi:hypothetical protein